MKWWKRLIFSVVSLIFGFVSLEYLFYAFRLLIHAENTTGIYRIENQLLSWLAGFALFVLWFVLAAVYVYVIRKNSSPISLIESDSRKKKIRFRGKWFELILQGAWILTGMGLRWCYLLLVYFPNQI